MATFRKNLLCLSALGAVMGGRAVAGVITESSTIANQVTDLSSVAFAGLPDYNGPLPLQSVQLAVTGTGSTTFIAQNDANTAQTFDATTTVYFYLTAPGIGTRYPLFRLSADSGMQTLANNSAATYGPVSMSNGSFAGFIYTDAATLALFTGPGNAPTSLSTLSILSVSGEGGRNVAISPTTSVSGTLEIIYTYQDQNGVPEPVSIALLGTGLVGLCIARSRRK